MWLVNCGYWCWCTGGGGDGNEEIKCNVKPMLGDIIIAPGPCTRLEPHITRRRSIHRGAIAISGINHPYQINESVVFSNSSAPLLLYAEHYFAVLRHDIIHRPLRRGKMHDQQCQ